MSNLDTRLVFSSQLDDKLKSVIVEGEEPAKGWCYVIPFDPMDIFPSFVRNKAYRPLAIQQVTERKIWTYPEIWILLEFFHCNHLPFLACILVFHLPGLGSYLMRATASYSYEGLIAVALFEPTVDSGRVTA